MRTIFKLTALLFISYTLSSCAQKMTFANSPVVPGASGKVKVKKDNNDNYIISVNVLNLAPAKDLTPPRDGYVVWMEIESNATKNIGQINPTSGMFSKAVKGSLKATSTTKPKRIFITAEDNGNVQYPGSQRVLGTN